MGTQLKDLSKAQLIGYLKDRNYIVVGRGYTANGLDTIKMIRFRFGLPLLDAADYFRKQILSGAYTEIV